MDIFNKCCCETTTTGSKIYKCILRKQIYRNIFCLPGDLILKFISKCALKHKTKKYIIYKKIYSKQKKRIDISNNNNSISLNSISHAQPQWHWKTETETAICVICVCMCACFEWELYYFLIMFEGFFSLFKFF